MIAPYDVFVQDSSGVTWIGMAHTITDAKSIALQHPEASQIKNIIIFSQKTLRKMVIRMGGDGPSIDEEEDVLEA